MPNWNEIFEYRDCELDAALAYDDVAIARHGEYARTNKMLFPEDFKC